MSRLSHQPPKSEPPKATIKSRHQKKLEAEEKKRLEAIKANGEYIPNNIVDVEDFDNSESSSDILNEENKSAFE